MRSKVFFVLLFGFGVSHFLVAQQTRSINGSNTNVLHPLWGAQGTPMLELCDAATYRQSYNSKNARQLSNLLCAQQGEIPNANGLSDFIWVWGQFLSHDISLSKNNTFSRIENPVPLCDSILDPGCLGNKKLLMMQSAADTTKTELRFINYVSSYLDASLLYSNSPSNAKWIRLGKDGKLKSSEEGYLPYNTYDATLKTAEDKSAPQMEIMAAPNIYFVSGDVRVNIQPTLIGLHTLFFREHNRLCDELKLKNPDWTDDQLFQKARSILEGLLQHITYIEFLPALGIHLDPYTGFDPNVNPGAFNEFSAAAFRLHSFVSDRIPRLDEKGDSTIFEAFTLLKSFGDLNLIKKEGGLESMFRGIANHPAQQMDLFIVDDMRNSLITPKHLGGGDIATTNITRGRDRALPKFNEMRQCLGLAPYSSFELFTGEQVIATKLKSVYQHVDSIELWIGLMAEKHQPGNPIGQTLSMIIKRQFVALRDGDPFYYKASPLLTEAEKKAIEQTTLSDIIKRNTTIKNIQKNVFFTDPYIYPLFNRGDDVLRSMFLGSIYKGNLLFKIMPNQRIDSNKPIKIEIWDVKYNKNIYNMQPIDNQNELHSMNLSALTPNRLYRLSCTIGRRQASIDFVIDGKQ